MADLKNVRKVSDTDMVCLHIERIRAAASIINGPAIGEAKQAAEAFLAQEFKLGTIKTEES